MFVVGLLLGILQLAVGVIIGRAISLNGRPASLQADHQRLRTFTLRLRHLVNSVADDVDSHQADIERVHGGLDQCARDATERQSESGESSDGSGALTQSVLSTVAEIMQINERLQSRLSAAEDKLQQQAVQIESHLSEARTDALTGLPNRRAFDDELVRRVAEWNRKRATFCLMMIDADHFKDLNDRYGHPAGDQVLRTIAEVLRNTFREMDLLARVGGEEFAAILPSTNSRDARRAVQRILAAVADQQFEFEQQCLRVTVSVGLTAVQEGDDGFLVFKRADEALYASKTNGRNCGHFNNGRKCVLIDPDHRRPQGNVEQELERQEHATRPEPAAPDERDSRSPSASPQGPAPENWQSSPTSPCPADAIDEPATADGPPPSRETVAPAANSLHVLPTDRAAEESTADEVFGDKKALVAMFARHADTSGEHSDLEDPANPIPEPPDPSVVDRSATTDLHEIQQRLKSRLDEMGRDNTPRRSE